MGWSGFWTSQRKNYMDTPSADLYRGTAREEIERAAEWRDVGRALETTTELCNSIGYVVDGLAQLLREKANLEPDSEWSSRVREEMQRLYPDRKDCWPIEPKKPRAPKTARTRRSS